MHNITAIGKKFASIQVIQNQIKHIVTAADTFSLQCSKSKNKVSMPCVAEPASMPTRL